MIRTLFLKFCFLKQYFKENYLMDRHWCRYQTWINTSSFIYKNKKFGLYSAIQQMVAPLLHSSKLWIINYWLRVYNINKSTFSEKYFTSEYKIKKHGSTSF